MRLDTPGKYRDVTVARCMPRAQLPPARDPRPGPRPAHAAAHQPARPQSQTADRALRTTLVDRERARRPDPRLHLDALSSEVPLAVDLDTTLSVLCDSIYRNFARRIQHGYATATPDTIFRHFIATLGDIHVTDNAIEVRLRPRAHTSVLLSAGYADPPPSHGATAASSATASRQRSQPGRIKRVTDNPG